MDVSLGHDHAFGRQINLTVNQDQCGNVLLFGSIQEPLTSSSSIMIQVLYCVCRAPSLLGDWPRSAAVADFPFLVEFGGELGWLFGRQDLL